MGRVIQLIFLELNLGSDLVCERGEGVENRYIYMSVQNVRGFSSFLSC